MNGRVGPPLLRCENGGLYFLGGCGVVWCGVGLDSAQHAWL